MLIYFKKGSEPIRTRRASLLSWLASDMLARRLAFRRPGGGSVLAQNLLLELGMQNHFAWVAVSQEIPEEPVDVTWVINSRRDLRLGLRLKAEGRTKRLCAGPNLVVVPQEAEPDISAQGIDDYIVPCEWVSAFYAAQAPYLKEKLRLWPVGIDVNFWDDTLNRPKTNLLIYNKNQPESAQAVMDQARGAGHRTEMITYGRYTPAEYRAALSRAWGMVWLSASETQGLACLEALSMNVPVLAWNPGQWSYESPSLKRHFSAPASSVPYFDPSCGLTFKTTGECPTALAQFSESRAAYHPRSWLLKQDLDLASNLNRLPFLQDL